MSELIAQPTQEIAVYQSLVDDLDIPNDKLIIPRINLLQALSEAVQERGQPQGTFNNSVTDANYGDTVTVIPIKINFGALYFVKNEGMKCKSVDGVTNMYGNPCSQCPFGVYYRGEWKDGKPPKCSETIDMLCVDTAHREAAILTFRNTSYKEGRRILTTLKMRRGQALSITIGAEKTKNDSGIFYVMKQKSIQTVDADMYRTASLWKDALLKTDYQAHEDIDFPPAD